MYEDCMDLLSKITSVKSIIYTRTYKECGLKPIIEADKDCDTPTDDQVKDFVQNWLQSGKVVPGYGHVLRAIDPRYMAFRNFAEKYVPDDKGVKIVWQLQKIVPPILQQTKKVQDVCPNLDAHSGALLQVLGTFSLKAPRLMVNPQLDGMKSLNTGLKSNSSYKDSYTEAEEAVENLFNSCDDADNWISYPTRKRKHARESRRKSKWSRSSSDETGGRACLGFFDPNEIDEETAILRSMHEDKLNNEFEDDMELNTELEKYRLISENGIHSKDDDDDDEIWNHTSLDIDDLLVQMGA